MALKPNPTSSTFSGRYIQEVTLPDSFVYEIVDAGARTEIDAISTNINSISSNVDSLSGTISAMSNYSAFLGVISNSANWTKITDGSSNATILVGSTTMTAETGNIVIYKPTANATAQEFIWDGNNWNFFGDIGAKDFSTSTVTASGSFTPAGTASFNSTTTAYVKLSHTTVEPESTTNYWVYKPAGSVTVTVANESTTTGITDITGRNMVASVTIGTPATATPTGGIKYAEVFSNNLILNYLVTSAANTIHQITTATMTTSITATAAAFDGTTIYSQQIGISIPNSVTFAGTAASVTVNSGTNKFVTM